VLVVRLEVTKNPIVASRHQSTACDRSGSLSGVSSNRAFDYPRSPEHAADGDPIGRAELLALSGRSWAAVAKWFERRSLPLADGPMVNGAPTWRRRTLLAHLWRANLIGASHPLADEAKGWSERVSQESTTSVRALERAAAAEG
jgi:hypothetical protein